MDIKYPIENKYMKCVLQINGFSGPRLWIRGRDNPNEHMGRFLRMANTVKLNGVRLMSLKLIYFNPFFWLVFNISRAVLMPNYGILQTLCFSGD